MSEQNRKRRRRLVDSEVQLGLAKRIIFHWIAFFLVAGIVGVTMQFLSDPLKPISEHLASLGYTLGPYVVAMLFLLPVFVVDTVKFSLRFAGPIFRLRQLIHDLAQGKRVQRLETRNNDFWRSTVDEFNLLVDRLNQESDQREGEMVGV